MVAWVKFPGPILLAAQTVEQVKVGIFAFRPYLGLLFSWLPHVGTDQPRLQTRESLEGPQNCILGYPGIEGPDRGSEGIFPTHAAFIR